MRTFSIRLLIIFLPRCALAVCSSLCFCFSSIFFFAALRSASSRTRLLPASFSSLRE